jgi:hypothetical protein
VRCGYNCSAIHDQRRAAVLSEAILFAGSGRTVAHASRETETVATTDGASSSELDGGNDDRAGDLVEGVNAKATGGISAARF